VRFRSELLLLKLGFITFFCEIPLGGVGLSLAANVFKMLWYALVYCIIRYLVGACQMWELGQAPRFEIRNIAQCDFDMAGFFDKNRNRLSKHNFFSRSSDFFRII